MRKLALFLIFLVTVVWGQTNPDVHMTTPDNLDIWENPDYESVRHWVIPDTNYINIVKDNNVGSCSYPWDNFVSRNYWIKMANNDCLPFASGEWSAYANDSIFIPIPPGDYPDTIYLVSDSIFIFDSVLISDTIYFSGDTLYIIDSIYVNIYDTVFSSSETLAVFDTLWVMGNNGIYFTSYKSYLCESLLTSIDTTKTPDDSFYCIFCDSILNTIWFEVICSDMDCDTFQFETWRTQTPSSDDRCDLIPNGTIHSSGTYWGDSVYIGEVNYTGFYVKDTLSGIVERIDYDDTLYLGNSRDPYEGGSGGIGVFVKSCDCNAIAETLVTDSAAVMFCISTDWFARTSNNGILYRSEYDEGQVMPSYYSDDYYDFARCVGTCSTREQFYESSYWTVMRSDDVGYSGGYANNAYYIQHYIPRDYGAEIINLVDSLFPNGRVFTLIGDSTISPPSTAFYFDFDTTVTAYGCFTGDTSSSYRWHDTSNYAFYPNKPHASYKFFNWIHFNEILTSEEIAGLNANQPDWIIIPMADDGVPYISIGDSTFWVMDDDDYYYGALSYRISPNNIRYDLPVYIETGVYSDYPPFVGAQVLIALDYGIVGDTVITSCVEFQDTITLPDCYECSDSICFKFAQGMLGNANLDGYMTNTVGYCIGDVVVCYSVCELDTLDLSGQDEGVLYREPTYIRIMSPDSTDTFTITQNNDSLIIGETGTIPIEIRSDIELGDNSLKFYDFNKSDTTFLYQTMDTFHISTNDTSVIVKIGSGSLFMSDQALWFGGNYIDHDVYGFALGNNDTVTGEYAVAWGFNANSTNDYSTAWGMHCSATAPATTAWGFSCNAILDASTAWGYYSTASGVSSTAWGEENLASGNGATTWGWDNEANGYYSTSWGKNTKSNAIYSTTWGENLTSNGAITTVSGRYLFADSLADYSFFIGIDDSLYDDSTFCSSYPYNEFRGELKISESGTSISKIIKIGSHLAIICGSDTLWCASDTTGF